MAILLGVQPALGISVSYLTPEIRVPRKITEIIAKARCESLSKNAKNGQATEPTTKFEWISLFHLNTFSIQFLQALPTKIAITPNDVFSVGIHNLLGQLCPLLKYFKKKPYYIGRK